MLSKRQAIQHRFLRALAGVAIVVVSLEMVLQFLPVMSSLSTVEVNDDSPVFRHSPNRDYFWSKGWNFSTVIKRHTNNYGFVNDLDYDETIDFPPLIAVIGDNFVVASMIPYQHTFYGQLSERIADQGRIYSFGAGAAPLSQFLAYAEYAGKTFAPEAMIFVITYNTLDRNLLDQDSIPGFNYFDEGATGELVLTRTDFKPNLIRRILRQSALARYFAWNLDFAKRAESFLVGSAQYEAHTENSTSGGPQHIDPERIAVEKRAIDAFLEQLPVRSGISESRHLFLVDGVRPNLYASTELAAASSSFHGVMRRYFMSTAQLRGYEVIDMQPLILKDFRITGLRSEFLTDPHWNEHGHGVAADAIAASRTYTRALDTRD